MYEGIRGGQLLTDIVFTVLGPRIDGKVEVALCIHIALEGNVPRRCGLPPFARCHVGDALPCHGILAGRFVGVCGGTAAAIGPCTSIMKAL